MTITDANKTKRGRISIWVDGEFMFAVEEEVWHLSGLKAGNCTSEEQLNALLLQSREKAAKRRALNMLASRSYSSKNLERRLAEKAGTEAAQTAVLRMQELGLVNDEDYALRFAQELFSLRGYAPRRIRLELQKRGISAELCALAIEQLDCEDFDARALELLSARFGVLKSEADIRRASALLERYGYSFSDIKSAIRALSEMTLDDEG